MKKNHGLYLITLGVAVFICYFLAGALYGSGQGRISYFLNIAWPMPAIVLLLTICGVFVFIKGD